MTEPQVIQGIAPGSDHYVPRLGVYLGPPDAAPSDPPPAASLVDEANARAEEEDRIRQNTGVRSNGGSGASLQALDGPWGDPNGAITNDVISVEFAESLEPERL